MKKFKLATGQRQYPVESILLKRFSQFDLINFFRSHFCSIYFIHIYSTNESKYAGNEREINSSVFCILRNVFLYSLVYSYRTSHTYMTPIYLPNDPLITGVWWTMEHFEIHNFLVCLKKVFWKICISLIQSTHTPVWQLFNVYPFNGHVSDIRN